MIHTHNMIYQLDRFYKEDRENLEHNDDEEEFGNV
jgi:hypothetical protein